MENSWYKALLRFSMDTAGAEHDLYLDDIVISAK